ncbi:MAG: GNAT family N-acetyltransferase [Acidiferrobacterales bacterium]
MIPNITIQRATADDAQEVAVLVGELLDEIMGVIGLSAFNFSLIKTERTLRDFIDREKYFVFVATAGDAGPMGFVALYESYALYAEGTFGTLPEFYVRPAYRSQGVGQRLMDQAKVFGTSRSWKRLEVTTPPLPQYDKTLSFYERAGFTVTGGCRLKVAL